MANFNVQTTFTKQKRLLEKANSLISQIRAQEVREQRFSPDDKLQTEERTAYLTEAPTAIASQVVAIVADVIRQHGARQKSNSVSTGRFEFCDVEADLTVPQLRALQEALGTISTLVDRLPTENLRRVPNGEVGGFPAFFTPIEKHYENRVRQVPYEEVDSTRIRTYEETYRELVYQTRTVTIDRGLPTATVARLREMVADLATAIQVAIDEANGKGREEDPVLNDVAARVLAAFEAQWNPQNAAQE